MGGDEKGRSESNGSRSGIDGNPSQVDGNPSQVDGNPSHADGNPSQADGNPSQVDGNPSQADGNPSQADGNPLQVDGNSSRQQDQLLDSERPGQTNADSQGLRMDSEIKATPPVKMEHSAGTEPYNEDDWSPSPLNNMEESRQEFKIEEIGSYATRLKFEQAKSHYERLQEAMKERAIATMMECLVMQQHQNRIEQQRLSAQQLPVRTSRGLSGELHSKRSLMSGNPSAMGLLQRSAVIQSSLNSEMSSISTMSKAKPATPKQGRLNELEKQVNRLEKQCKNLDRHLREHDRDQKNMQTKIHRLEMRILHDGQKEIVWDIMDKIPTEEDVKTLESFHSFAVERQRTESQIKVLNVKVKALNQAMGKTSGPQVPAPGKDVYMQLEKKSSIPKQPLVRLDIPDFTLMSLDEREEFFRRAGVTLYEYDKEDPEPVETRQQKQRTKKLRSKKVNILDEMEAPIALKAIKRKPKTPKSSHEDDLSSSNPQGSDQLLDHVTKASSPSGSDTSTESNDSAESTMPAERTRSDSEDSDSSPERNTEGKGN